MNRSREDVTFKLDGVSCIVCESDMIWQDDIREWVCPTCGNRAFQTEDCGPDEIYYEHGLDDDYEEIYEEYYDLEDQDMQNGSF